MLGRLILCLRTVYDCMTDLDPHKISWLGPTLGLSRKISLFATPLFTKKITQNRIKNPVALKVECFSTRYCIFNQKWHITSILNTQNKRLTNILPCWPKLAMNILGNIKERYILVFIVGLNAHYRRTISQRHTFLSMVDLRARLSIARTNKLTRTKIPAVF